MCIRDRVQLECHAFTDQQGRLQRTGLITHPAIKRVHTSLRTGTPEQSIDGHIKGAGNGICSTGPLGYRIGKDDGFRIENGCLLYTSCFVEFLPVCDYFLTLNIVCLQYFLRHEYYSEYLRYSLYIL